MGALHTPTDKLEEGRIHKRNLKTRGNSPPGSPEKIENRAAFFLSKEKYHQRLLKVLGNCFLHALVEADVNLLELSLAI